MLLFMVVTGWFGTIMYLVNHAYISFVRDWRANVYYTGNLLAATALTVQSFYLSSWQAVAINGFWMITSMLLLLGVRMDRIKIRSLHYFTFSGILLASVLASIFFIELTQFYDVMAWSAAYFFCSSYFLFTAKRIPSRAYLAINIYAALALLPQLWLSANYPVFTLEIAWAIVSLIGMIRTYNEVHLID
jgi:hypothetical protein